jgi:hypothetical protein
LHGRERNQPARLAQIKILLIELCAQVFRRVP